MSYRDKIIDLIEREVDGEEHGEPNEMKNVPSQDPEEELRRVEDDISGMEVELDDTDEYGDENYEDEKDLKGITSEMVDMILLDQDSAYQAYFRGVMKKHGIEGIRGLSAEKRSVFFKDVSAGWRKHKKGAVKEEQLEVPELKVTEPLYEDYKKYCIVMMEKCDINDLRELSEEDRNGFFELTNEAWALSLERMYDRILFEDYKKYFKGMMKKHDIKNLSDLEGDEKKNFFKKVNAGWKSKEELDELMQKPGQGYDTGLMKPEPKQRPRPEKLRHGSNRAMNAAGAMSMHAANQPRRI